MIDSRSIGDSFQRRIGSSSRPRNRRSCSASLTENQYLRSRTPSSTSSRSKIGHWCRNRWYSSLVQNPITRSTPARLYQLRSNSTISPAAGRCSTYRWKYHWVRSPLGRRRQRHDPGDPRVEVLRHPLDRAALAGRVPALEDHHQPGALGRDPLLHLQPAVQATAEAVAPAEPVTEPAAGPAAEPAARTAGG